MKTITTAIALFLVLPPLFGASPLGNSVAVRLRVVDETGVPLAGAKAGITFIMGPREDERSGSTDKDGQFSARGDARFGLYLEASKDGYYPARFEPFGTRADVDKTVVLPKMLKPTALYVNRATSSDAVKLSVQNEWLGYDFEVGDWVQPRGKGKATDILFRFRNEFKGYRSSGETLARSLELSRQSAASRNEVWSEEKFRLSAGKWDAVLDISFPGQKEGLHEEKERFLTYSSLKMPHEAPADGYVPTWRYTATTYTDTTTRDNVGFFLRTRVKLDDKGNIVSANYVKIVKDFRLDARGALAFTSYFNPTPNDRNLEFDPKKNLFPANFPGANVGDP